MTEMRTSSKNLRLVHLLRSNDRNTKEKSVLRTESETRSVLQLVTLEHCIGVDNRKNRKTRKGIIQGFSRTSTSRV